MVPPQIEQAVLDLLKKEHDEIIITDFIPASGGCINNGGRLKTSFGDYFVKWNSSTRYPGMFKNESEGLKMLSEANCLRVPHVVSHGETGPYNWLLLEHIESSGRNGDYWDQMGRNLALLHRNSNELFGLDNDNYIGSLPQRNTPSSNWIEFLIAHRFEPMIKMAFNDRKLDQKDKVLFEKLYGKLQGLLVYEKPSLLHGDLWSGNVMVDNKGAPVLIDPAVYYGHREVDLAFTTLFGGFNHIFYESYREEWPLEDGFEERFDLYNLYPLLVHVNLFGGSYINQARSILARFV